MPPLGIGLQYTFPLTEAAYAYCPATAFFLWAGGEASALVIGTRVKWEPAALMALVLGLGVWLAFGSLSADRFPVSPDAVVTPVRIGDTRGILEAMRRLDEPDDPWRFRLWFRHEPSSPRELTRAEAESILGPRVVNQSITGRRPVFRWLNITSWVGFVWVCVGFAGQLLFSGRMVLQWLVSERSRKSVISESFWWFSLAGGMTLFAYFIWRQDPVPLLGQAAGIVIYIRNIRLFRKHARRIASQSESISAAATP